MTLYRKYRPQKFAEVVGQDPIRDSLLQAIRDNRLSQAYLFTGPRGTGKTTTARLIAKAANCLDLEEKKKSGKEVSGEPCGKCESCLEIGSGKSLDIIEIDAASNRGIDEIRQLREQVRFAPVRAKYKVYIIDEVHMLTREAFNALLKTLEEPPAHAIFILATTEPHKVLPTIISRTQRFDFGRIPMPALIKNLETVAKSEKFKIDKEALEIIAMLAEGGSRDSLSLLEKVASYSSDISIENVRSILGIAEIDQVVGLIRAIFNSEAEEGLKIAQALFGSGVDFSQLNSSILNVLRKILNWSVAGEFLLDDTEKNRKQILSLAKISREKYGSASISIILKIIREFIECGKLMKDTIDPLVAMEVTIISASELANAKTDIILSPPKIVKTNIEIKKEEIVSKEKKIEQAHQAEQKAVLNTVLSKESNIEADKEEIESQNNNKDEDDKALPKLLNELDENLWKEVIGELKRENNSLAALLKDAKPMAVEKGKLVLGVRFKFHKDKISEAKNVKILEGVICSVTKSSCRVFCEIADFNSKPTVEASDDELAEEAERIFAE